MNKKNIPDPVINRDILDSFKNRSKFLEETFQKRAEKFSKKFDDSFKDATSPVFGLCITAIPEKHLFLKDIDCFELPSLPEKIEAKRGEKDFPLISLPYLDAGSHLYPKTIIQGLKFGSEKTGSSYTRSSYTISEVHYDGLIEYYFLINQSPIMISWIEAWIVHVMATVSQFRKKVNCKTDYFISLKIRQKETPEVKLYNNLLPYGDSKNFNNDAEFSIYRLGDEGQFNDFLAHLDRSILSAAGFEYHKASGLSVDFENLN